jgi:hypothetical protein
VLETAECRAEREELETLLRSGVFNRAPHLVRFLAYICERYFEGQADQIKEYTIGVEAFKRLPGFDPKKDSIVRVEAHRLRRRLTEYYATEGAGHRLHIIIPSGQYIPQFIFRDHSGRAASLGASPSQWHSASLPSVSLGDSPPTPVPGAQSEPVTRVKSLRVRLVAALALCLLAAFLIWGFFRSRADRDISPSREETWGGASTQPVPAEFRLLAGYHGAPFTDQQGHTWSSDSYFTGGFSSPIPSQRMIDGEPDTNLLRTQREGEFHYDIPLTQGTHELRLHFAETEYGPGNARGGGEAARLFGISINGVEAVRWFDPLAEAGGPNRLVVRVFKDVSPDTDGKLHILFRPAVSQGRTVPRAFLNAIEILQSKPGFIHPVRIVTQDRPVTDMDGRTWSSDQYFFGGTHVFRSHPVVSARDKALYRGERYGNFAYHIPLAPGKYRVTLHFAETWFGTPDSNQAALGARRFNVFANGAALLQNFEIAKEAGVNREVAKVFDKLEPNAQGSLWLEFVPVENYAEVNAIEIEQTE